MRKKSRRGTGLTAEERAKKKQQAERKRKTREFKKKIKNIFIMAGFIYLNTENKHVEIGPRTVELDSVFIYKNILLICEDTSIEDIKPHMRKKNETSEVIKKDIAQLVKWLTESFKEYKDAIDEYTPEEYKVFYLYFTEKETGFTKNQYDLFSHIKIVEPQFLNYLDSMAKCIKKSVKYEVLRFLNLNSEDIGTTTTEDAQKNINATIISPKKNTGITTGVRIVSFMMSADTLIRNSFVMRKDSWEDAVFLYQRLIKKEKIKAIRKFLVKKEESFYNNIIVTLPDDVIFLDQDKNPVELKNIGKFATYNMIIPDKMNSICIIDGQHRVFAHYEGLENDTDEEKISKLRKELHLLVTGLVFPKDMPPIQRAQIEGEIFSDINSNAKSVPADILLHVQMNKYPLSDLGLARKVIERLNSEKIFFKKFEMSSLDKGKIKIASIIKFALRYLVTIESKDRKSLYYFWEGDKSALIKFDQDAFDEYINYCIKNITDFFSAVKKNFNAEWHNPQSKLLSVTAINGFIIAFNKIIDKDGVKDFNYYDQRLQKLGIDFSKDNFPYTSSQYSKFSEKIIDEAFRDTE